MNKRTVEGWESREERRGGSVWCGQGNSESDEVEIFEANRKEFV